MTGGGLRFARNDGGGGDPGYAALAAFRDDKGRDDFGTRQGKGRLRDATMEGRLRDATMEG